MGGSCPIAVGPASILPQLPLQPAASPPAPTPCAPAGTMMPATPSIAQRPFCSSALRYQFRASLLTPRFRGSAEWWVAGQASRSLAAAAAGALTIHGAGGAWHAQQVARPGHQAARPGQQAAEASGSQLTAAVRSLLQRSTCAGGWPRLPAHASANPASCLLCPASSPKPKSPGMVPSRCLGASTPGCHRGRVAWATTAERRVCGAVGRGSGGCCQGS